ncbi:MAG: hypothetical protein C4519_01775 [Desulfobacteraceae bacterium]|nr:MAG: hypothetical protein C4519_01775 [Desulfobacteraceae bacterium]
MEDSRRKQLEAQLRQLINAANREAPQSGPDGSEGSRKIQVIRRRKGKPDRHILENRSPENHPALQQ